jgi:hypothetical protein
MSPQILIYTWVFAITILNIAKLETGRLDNLGLGENLDTQIVNVMPDQMALTPRDKEDLVAFSALVVSGWMFTKTVLLPYLGW